MSRYEADGRLVAAKIKGKYWMHWGDAQIWLATSDDLIHWTPIEMAPGEKPPAPLRAQAVTMPTLKIVLPTRQGKFDSDLVESGPPAMLTDQGIRLLYNSRNVPAIGDKSLPEGTYSAAQALFDKNDPTKLLQRTDTYFMRPEKPYETTGQVNQVVFWKGWRASSPSGFCTTAPPTRRLPWPRGPSKQLVANPSCGVLRRCTRPTD